MGLNTYIFTVLILNQAFVKNHAVVVAEGEHSYDGLDTDITLHCIEQTKP
jgi:hypothetical protein